MRMHNPSHPGEVLAEWIDGLNVSVTDFAAHIEISHVALTAILNGQAAITADIALRLSEALGTTPESWLGMQTQRDLWCAIERAKERPPVARIAPSVKPESKPEQ